MGEKCPKGLLNWPVLNTGLAQPLCALREWIYPIWNTALILCGSAHATSEDCCLTVSEIAHFSNPYTARQ